MNKKPSASIQIAGLVSDPDFLRLQELYDQPNLFRAVGRTFTETWHSAFLGWLLNPRGSHNLGVFPIQRFLAAVVTADVTPDETPDGICGADQLARYMIDFDFSNATVFPSENGDGEKRLGNAGRIDVFIEVDRTPVEDGDECVDSSVKKLKFFVEMKVDASLAQDQAKKYADHAENKARESSNEQGPFVSHVCVFIARTEAIGEDSEGTTGDKRWFCIDYQAIHDFVLVPSLEHHELNPVMRPLIEHYVQNMRWSGQKGGALAVTEEERELARRVYKRYESVFHTLARLLEENEIPEALSPSDRKEKLPLQIRLETGETLEGKNVRWFLTEVLTYCHERHLLDGLELPFQMSKSRNLIVEYDGVVEPSHPSGKGFVRAMPFPPEDSTLHVEINISRKTALSQAEHLLRELGVRFVPGSV